MTGGPPPPVKPRIEAILDPNPMWCVTYYEHGRRVIAVYHGQPNDMAPVLGGTKEFWAARTPVKVTRLTEAQKSMSLFQLETEIK